MGVNAATAGLVVMITWTMVIKYLAPLVHTALLWATNKLFVLAYFVLLLGWLLAGAGRRLRWETGR